MDQSKFEDSLVVSSQEGKEFKISKKSATLSKLLFGALQDFQGEINVPLQEIDDKTMQRAVDYLEHWQGLAPPEIEKPLKSKFMEENTDKWSADYINSMTLPELADLAVAANFMEIHPLLELACAKIASTGKDKSDDELFTEYGIDPALYTEEVKEKIKQENQWLEDNPDDD